MKDFFGKLLISIIERFGSDVCEGCVIWNVGPLELHYNMDVLLEGEMCNEGKIVSDYVFFMFHNGEKEWDLYYKEFEL